MAETWTQTGRWEWVLRPSGLRVVGCPHACGTTWMPTDGRGAVLRAFWGRRDLVSLEEAKSACELHAAPVPALSVRASSEAKE